MEDSSNPYRSPVSRHCSRNQDDNAPKNKELTGKLIVLSTFENAFEAHLFRNELEANGLVAKLGNETTTAIFGATIAGPTSAFWIEVLIMESDSAKGLEIKKQWALRQEEDVAEIPEWICKCGETVDAGFALCWNCDTDYKISEK